MSNSKESRTATPTRSHIRARARNLDSGRRLGRSSQVMFPSRRLAEGPGPAAGLSKWIKPFWLMHARHGRTHAAPPAPSERRRGGGQNGVGA